MTISLTINDIPDYLKDSELCKNIVSDESFDIPIEFFKKELIINSFEDLIDYIKIFNYWIINKIPNELYKFVLENKDKINMVLLNEQFHMNDLINQIKIIIETSNDKISSYFSSIGNLELLKYAHEHNYSWDKETYELAALNGHLECLKYAYKNNCPGQHFDCECNNKNVHNIIKYKSPLDKTDIMTKKYYNKDWKFLCNCNSIISNAVINGHLDCLKYAHENGCEWDSKTCYGAAQYGHLDCLKYAHENGCEWNVEICWIAAGKGHLDCLKYAHEKLYIFLKNI